MQIKISPKRTAEAKTMNPPWQITWWTRIWRSRWRWELCLCLISMQLSTTMSPCRWFCLANSAAPTNSTIYADLATFKASQSIRILPLTITWRRRLVLFPHREPKIWGSSSCKRARARLWVRKHHNSKPWWSTHGRHPNHRGIRCAWWSSRLTAVDRLKMRTRRGHSRAFRGPSPRMLAIVATRLKLLMSLKTFIRLRKLPYTRSPFWLPQNFNSKKCTKLKNELDWQSISCPLQRSPSTRCNENSVNPPLTRSWIHVSAILTRSWARMTRQRPLRAISRKPRKLILNLHQRVARQKLAAKSDSCSQLPAKIVNWPIAFPCGTNCHPQRSLAAAQTKFER